MVEDAWSPPTNQMGVVVEFTLTPKFVVGSNAKAPPELSSASHPKVPALQVSTLFEVQLESPAP